MPLAKMPRVVIDGATYAKNSAKNGAVFAAGFLPSVINAINTGSKPLQVVIHEMVKDEAKYQIQHQLYAQEWLTSHPPPYMVAITNECGTLRADLMQEIGDQGEVKKLVIMLEVDQKIASAVRTLTSNFSHYFEKSVQNGLPTVIRRITDLESKANNHADKHADMNKALAELNRRVFVIERTAPGAGQPASLCCHHCKDFEDVKGQVQTLKCEMKLVHADIEKIDQRLWHPKKGEVDIQMMWKFCQWAGKEMEDKFGEYDGKFKALTDKADAAAASAAAAAAAAEEPRENCCGWDQDAIDTILKAAGRHEDRIAQLEAHNPRHKEMWEFCDSLNGMIPHLVEHIGSIDERLITHDTQIAKLQRMAKPKNLRRFVQATAEDAVAKAVAAAVASAIQASKKTFAEEFEGIKEAAQGQVKAIKEATQKQVNEAMAEVKKIKESTQKQVNDMKQSVQNQFDEAMKEAETAFGEEVTAMKKAIKNEAHAAVAEAAAKQDEEIQNLKTETKQLRDSQAVLENKAEAQEQRLLAQDKKLEEQGKKIEEQEERIAAHERKINTQPPKMPKLSFDDEEDLADSPGASTEPEPEPEAKAPAAAASGPFSIFGSRPQPPKGDSNINWGAKLGDFSFADLDQPPAADAGASDDGMTSADEPDSVASPQGSTPSIFGKITSPPAPVANPASSSLRFDFKSPPKEPAATPSMAPEGAFDFSMPGLPPVSAAPVSSASNLGAGFERMMINGQLPPVTKPGQECNEQGRPMIKPRSNKPATTPEQAPTPAPTPAPAASSPIPDPVPIAKSHARFQAYVEDEEDEMDITVEDEDVEMDMGSQPAPAPTPAPAAAPAKPSAAPRPAPRPAPQPSAAQPSAASRPAAAQPPPAAAQAPPAAQPKQQQPSQKPQQPEQAKQPELPGQKIQQPGQKLKQPKQTSKPQYPVQQPQKAVYKPQQPTQSQQPIQQGVRNTKFSLDFYEQWKRSVCAANMDFSTMIGQPNRDAQTRLRWNKEWHHNIDTKNTDPRLSTDQLRADLRLPGGVRGYSRNDMERLMGAWLRKVFHAAMMDTDKTDMRALGERYNFLIDETKKWLTSAQADVA
ncbi:hypothetical protein KVR01_008036 [Diaporthe batatas]|uniref:uncharacterized protein n=1 Tax=Diaporthe batatas TaxID=748121 RepID=UPI001D05026F|nr:uncharacterized protein KVR01_008036 [Diaporthe batatas]KAG8162271.1 hypothetical protein KVR01_008036 [Diaporthe batatas]